MIVIRDAAELPQISNPEIRDLVDLRILELSEDEPWDADVLGPFVVVEPGDQLEALDEQLGFSILANRFDGIRFDQAGYTQSHEILEEHDAGFFEIVFILSDDGYGVTVLVPKDASVDPNLLAMCALFATPATPG
jgi:hypothetical protein